MVYRMTFALSLLLVAANILFSLACGGSVAAVDLASTGVATSAEPPLAPDANATAEAMDVFISDAKSAKAPDLANGQWINSDPVTLDSLKGKVVLVEFWTFGCSNCLNTLPAIKSLNARYKDKGLTVVGIETPELDNEKSFANLQNAVKQAGIEYPILTDYDNANWNAYGVNAWPTIFILDQQGRIRYKHVGEGAYDTQEKVVAALLANAGGNDDEFDGKQITKTDAEWKKELGPKAYKVLRQADTEYPYTGEYWDNHEAGTYYCRACHLKVFTSDTKFESGTGWPSFYQVANKKNVIEKEDRSLGDVRTEVLCARCKSHLGHVFDDGPKPTGLRYCMNSLALKFEKK